MRTTKQLSITLPNNMAEALKERVASGAYASESEVVRDGLRALFAREDAVETWLRSEVVASYDELRADPSQAISSEDMRAKLARVHRERLAESGSCPALSSTRPAPAGSSPICMSGLPRSPVSRIGLRGL